MTRKQSIFLLIGVAIAAVAGTAAWIFLQPQLPQGVLETNGIVRGTEITVSSRLSGTIEAISVNEGMRIEAGAPIARLDAREIEAGLEQARASVENAFHGVHQAKEAIKRSDAEIRRAEIHMEQARRDYERYEKLFERDGVSRRVYEEAWTAFRISEASLQAAENAREAARATLQSAEAALSVTRGRVREVEATFADTRIDAPVGGTVVNRLVEKGEVVSPGTPVATIIDLDDLYVKVYVSEVNLGKIKIGDPARIFTDAFPDRHFTGTVTEISQEAEFTPREAHVREERTKFVFGVEIGVENPEGILKPGLPVDVTIKWAEDAPWPDRS